MGLFTQEERFVGELPFWYLVPEGGDRAPLVVVQHGYTGSKDSDLKYGVAYAEAGYRVAVTEALHHGSRGGENREASFAADFASTFGAVVEQTSVEIRAMLDEYAFGEVAMTGISMGGFITFLTASQDRRVTVACPLIGSPFTFWNPLSEKNPLSFPERFDHVALLIQNGVLDEVVRIEYAQELFDKLIHRRGEADQRLRMIAYPELAHEFPIEMQNESLAWVKKHLPA